MVIPYATVNKGGTWHGVWPYLAGQASCLLFWEEHQARAGQVLTKIQFAFEI